MHTVTSFRAAGLAPEHVGAVMADYVALERARSLRRACVTRFGGLAVVFAIAGPGVHWVTPVMSGLSVALCVAPPALAWVAERRREQALTRRLREVPGVTTAVVASPLDG